MICCCSLLEVTSEYAAHFYDTYVDDAIRKVLHWSKLHGLAPIVDLSDKNIEVLLGPAVEYAAASFWSHCCGIGQTPCPICGAAWTAQGKHAIQNWWARGLEFWKITQYSSQGARHYPVWFKLVGLRTSVIRALSMATLITARNWPIARTTMDASQCENLNDRPRFGLPAVTQKMSAYNLIRVLTAAGSTRCQWTSGCGVTAGAAPGWCL